MRISNFIFALLFLLSSGCATVGPGHVGVLWKASSGTQNQTYAEGLHSLWPWNSMYVYDLRENSHNEVLTALASNGLAIRLDATVLYKVNPNEVVAMQKEIGADYYQKILEPVLRSETRRVIGRYDPEQLYSTERETIEREIRQGVKEKIQGSHVDLEAVLILGVELPQDIAVAIEQKLEAEQEVLKMKYVIETSKADIERKRAEAEGIADYNRIVSASLTPKVLEYERIREMAKLADSPNSKMVVISPNTHTQLLLNDGSSK